MASIYDKSSLVLIPSGTKTGKVYSQVPTNGDGDFTFTRSSAATRVNADGNIEKETQNLLYQSNNFNSGFWTTPSSSVTGGQSGYNGLSDAWLVTIDAGSGSVRQDVTKSGVQTFSVYAKAGNTDWVALYIDSVSTDKPYVFFDLGNGVVGNNVNNNAIEGNIEHIVGGWYRCSIIYNKNTNQVRIFPADSNGVLGTTGDTIYIQDAQLEQGLVARDYIETTSAVYGGITDNVPRLDYTDSSCPALLLEPLRTNVLSHSEYIAAWQFVGSITRTSNYGVSPEGVQNSTRLQFSGASQEAKVAATSLTGCMASVYVKGTNGETIKFGSTGSEEVFTLNGSWQRLEKYNSGIPTNITINTYSGATARDIEVWGAQVEQGSYATSYIPTYGSSVSRVVDDTTIANLQSKNIVGNTFSYYFEWGDYVANRNFEMKDSSSFNFLFMVSRLIRYIKQDGSVDSLCSLPANGTSLKSLISYDGTTLKGYINGSLAGSVTNAKVDSFSDFNKLRLDRSMDDREELKQVMLFPTALTDQEAIDLTTI